MLYRLYIKHNEEPCADANAYMTKHEVYISDADSSEPSKDVGWRYVAQWKGKVDFYWQRLSNNMAGNKEISIASLKLIKGIKFAKGFKKEGWLIKEEEKNSTSYSYITDRKVLIKYLIMNGRGNEVHNYIDYIGFNIQKLRARNKITQEQLAKDIGIGVRTLQRWEKDETQPDIVGLNKLLNYFNIKYEDLVNRPIE